MKKYLILIITLFFATTIFAQTNFTKGFNNGYKKGYCQDQGVGCIEPIPPIAPNPKIDESSNSYNDGYNRGFQLGLSNRKDNNKSHKNIFEGHVEHIVDSIKELGLNAEFTGRNDILSDGKKFSGNAEYIYKDRMVIHGTILFNSDFNNLIGSLTPDKSKLTSHAISSVKSRVCNIGDKLDVNIDEFYDFLVKKNISSKYLKLLDIVGEINLNNLI